MTVDAVAAPSLRSNKRASVSWRSFSALCSSLAIAIALFNLVGWFLGSREMISWIVNVTPMKITGSLLVILIAVPTLRISINRSIRRFDRVALRVAALASFAGGLSGIVLSIGDRIEAGSIVLTSDAARALIENPFRISLASGMSLVLFALSLWLLPGDWVKGRQWSNGLALAAAANSVLTLFGYLHRVPSFFDESIYVPMPLAVSVAFLLLAFAINTTHPRRHLLSIVFSGGPGGRSARTLIPAVIIVPLVLGMVHRIMESHELMGPELASAAESTLIAVLLAGVVLNNALRIERREARLERIRAERDEEIESRLLLWDISDDLLCTAGPDGYFQRVNPAWSRTLGWEESDLRLRPFIEFVHPEDRERTLEEFAKLACGNRTTFMNRYRRTDGSYRTLQWSAAPQGERNQIIAIARDITDIVTARERVLDINRELETRVRSRTRELEATNRELESFSYAVSHDLRAPLRAIEGFSRIVADRYAGDIPEEGQHYLARVRAGATKMGELIDGIHALSRLNRGILEIEQIDLSAMASDVVGDLRAAEPDRHVEVLIEDGMTAHADRRLIRSLMLNLIGNAWKFTSKTPDACIQIGRNADETDGFFVRDNGVGFDVKHTDKLFTPFQRLHSNDQFEGSGLGLATVQRILNRHGGTVRASSTPGNGACFTFTLPTHTSEQES